MAFSAGVKISGLDDFIAPSQACIKPVESLPAERAARGVVSIEGAQAGADGQASAPQTAKITLNDCLACSGCITSAESVLITQQSVDELMAWRAANAAAGAPAALVASVAPQCWASIAAHYAVPPAEAAARVAGLFRTLGASLVVDVSLGRDLALAEACAEYGARVARGGERTLLAAACPGWVCYAEKTQHHTLPFLSSVKSPQQVAGSLLKRRAAALLGRPANQVYHVTLMPCFDKKLEASRDEFTLPGEPSCREVDLVLTSTEFPDLLRAAALDFPAAPAAPLDPFPLADGHAAAPDAGAGRVWGAPGVSGGFAEEVFRYAAEHFHQRRVRVAEPPGLAAAAGGAGGESSAAAGGDAEMRDAGSETEKEERGEEVVTWTQVRNSDFHELVLPPAPGAPPGAPPLKVARCYGFRNIQNVVRQLKSARGCAYSYVEVMACPAGCVNGGGQLRVPEGLGAISAEAPKERLRRVRDALAAGQAVRRPGSNPALSIAYQGVVGGAPLSEGARAWLHTTYTARTETLLNPIAIQW